ncbi:MAG: hypothetical protein ACYSTS_17010 [Planctomycetota bacterium]
MLLLDTKKTQEEIAKIVGLSQPKISGIKGKNEHLFNTKERPNREGKDMLKDEDNRKRLKKLYEEEARND